MYILIYMDYIQTFLHICRPIHTNVLYIHTYRCISISICWERECENTLLPWSQLCSNRDIIPSKAFTFYPRPLWWTFLSPQPRVPIVVGCERRPADCEWLNRASLLCMWYANHWACNWPGQTGLIKQMRNIAGHTVGKGSILAIAHIPRRPWKNCNEPISNIHHGHVMHREHIHQIGRNRTIYYQSGWSAPPFPLD